MKYRIKGAKDRHSVPLEDLITIITIESLVFQTFTEADTVRDLLRIKFWRMRWAIYYYDEQEGWSLCLNETSEDTPLY